MAAARGLSEARDTLREIGAPDVVIADYHLDDGDGIAAILALRADFGCSIAAILATADRSPEVRGRAHREDVVLLNKPVKPGPLRALLTRFSALRKSEKVPLPSPVQSASARPGEVTGESRSHSAGNNKSMAPPA